MRAAFVTAVCRDAAGVPAAIEGMLQTATNDREVTRTRLRAYQHEAAAVYWDMTPLLVVALVVFIALRYISRGVGMDALFVLAGMGSSLLWMVVFFARRIGAVRARSAAPGLWLMRVGVRYRRLPAGVPPPASRTGQCEMSGKRQAEAGLPNPL